MGNRFDAFLAGRIATPPALSTTRDGKPWVSFRLAVDDRVRNDSTGEWEKSQTVFHDIVAFGKLADRAVGTLRVGDPVIAHGEFRFRNYADRDGQQHTGTSFVASRIGPDLLLTDVEVQRDRDHSPASRPAQERQAAEAEAPSPTF